MLTSCYSQHGTPPAAARPRLGLVAARRPHTPAVSTHQHLASTQHPRLVLSAMARRLVASEINLRRVGSEVVSPRRRHRIARRHRAGMMGRGMIRVEGSVKAGCEMVCMLRGLQGVFLDCIGTASRLGASENGFSVLRWSEVVLPTRINVLL